MDRHHIALDPASVVAAHFAKPALPPAVRSKPFLFVLLKFDFQSCLFVQEPMKVCQQCS